MPPPTERPLSFSSFHSGVVNFAMGDGSVRGLRSSEIGADTQRWLLFQQLGSRSEEITEWDGQNTSVHVLTDTGDVVRLPLDAVLRVRGTASNNPETSVYRGSLTLDVSGSDPPAGSLRYYYGRRRLNLVSTSIGAVSLDDQTAIITGMGTVNGVPGHQFTVAITDGAPDAFGIDIRRPDGTTLFSAGPANVKHGNLRITL